MARQYKRDARGRFASGGSTGKRAGGTLAARASLRSSRKKLAAKDAADGSLKGTLSKRAQKAAVTRAGKRLKEAKKASTIRIAGRRGGTVGRPKGYVRPAAGKQQSRSKPASTKVVLDEARWRRVFQRAKTRGVVRASIEADRPGGPYNAKSERRGIRGYNTQVRAERFLLALTKSKSDPSKTASGLGELNDNFRSRSRGGTGSTSAGVAARNRLAKEGRQAKRAANKAAREAKAASPANTKAPRQVRAPRKTGVIKPPRIKTASDGDRVLKDLMRGMPTVPTRRKPDYVDPKTGLSTTNLGFDQPRQLSARKIASLRKSLEKGGWTSRSYGLGHEITYSKSFGGFGGASEVAMIRLTRKGGPLMSGQVEVTRSVSSRRGRRGAGGSVIEQKYGLPRKPRLSSTPRRKRR